MPLSDLILNYSQRTIQHLTVFLCDFLAIFTIDREVSTFGHVERRLKLVTTNVITNSEHNCYFLLISWPYFMQIIKYAKCSEKSIQSATVSTITFSSLLIYLLCRSTPVLFLSRSLKLFQCCTIFDLSSPKYFVSLENSM